MCTYQKGTITIFLISICLILGCTRSHHFTHESSDSHFQEINNKKIFISLMDNTKIEARIKRIDSDSLYYYSNKSEIENSIHRSKIISITKVNRARGFIEGLGIGVISGGGTMGLIAKMTAKGPYAGTDVAITGVFFGTICGTIGAIAGITVGSKDVYIFNKTKKRETGKL